jgi:hypothetical protein
VAAPDPLQKVRLQQLQIMQQDLADAQTRGQTPNIKVSAAKNYLIQMLKPDQPLPTLFSMEPAPIDPKNMLANNVGDIMKEIKDMEFTLTVTYDPATAIQALLAPGLDGMGERLVRLTFATFNDEQVRKDIDSIMRTGGTAGRLAGVLSEYIEFGVVDRVVANLGLPDVRLRVALISSFLMGIAAGRYIAKIPPLDTTDEDLLVRIVAPTIQDLLDPTSPLGEN